MKLVKEGLIGWLGNQSPMIEMKMMIFSKFEMTMIPNDDNGSVVGRVAELIVFKKQWRLTNKQNYEDKIKQNDEEKIKQKTIRFTKYACYCTS